MFFPGKKIAHHLKLLYKAILYFKSQAKITWHGEFNRAEGR